VEESLIPTRQRDLAATTTEAAGREVSGRYKAQLAAAEHSNRERARELAAADAGRAAALLQKDQWAAAYHAVST